MLTEDGKRVLFAGKGMAMFETREEAVASFDKTFDELWTRSVTPWWRNDRVEVIEPTQEQLRKIL